MNSLPTNTQKCTRHSYIYYYTSNVVPAYNAISCIPIRHSLYICVCVCVYRSAVRNVMALKLYLLFCELLMDCLVEQTRFSKLKVCGGRVNYRAILTISCDMQYTHLLAVTHTHTHTHTHIHTHTDTQTHTHTDTHICVYTWALTCLTHTTTCIHTVSLQLVTCP